MIDLTSKDILFEDAYVIAVNKPSGAIRPVIWVDPDLAGSSG